MRTFEKKQKLSILPSSPSPSPTPQPSGIVTLKSDKPHYVTGQTATITATVAAAYITPANSTLVIYGSVGNSSETLMNKTGNKTFTYVTAPLGIGNTVFTGAVSLSIEPAQLVTIDRAIARMKSQIHSSHGFEKLIAEGELAFLELIKSVLSIFEHPILQPLENDKLILIVN